MQKGTMTGDTKKNGSCLQVKAFRKQIKSRFKTTCFACENKLNYRAKQVISHIKITCFEKSP